MRKNILQRLVRRCAWARSLGLKHLASVRKERADANWKYVQSVLSSIGTLLITWSLIERQINTLICQYHHIAPEKMRARGLPTSLGEKIRYLATIAKDERLPLKLRLPLSRWIPELSRLKEHRDLIVHGNLSQVGRSLRWRSQLVTLKGNEPVLLDRYFTNDELHDKSRQIAELSHAMAIVLTPILLPDIELRQGAAE